MTSVSGRILYELTDKESTVGRVPFRCVSKKITANFSSIWNYRRIMKKRLVPDLHLKEFLISSGELLGP